MQQDGIVSPPKPTERTDNVGAMPTAAPQRTSRNERRTQTMARLLDATIESLTEVGYTATTVRGVARRAGVSQGATTHHFPQRLDLIAAALDEVANRLVTGQRAQIPLLPREPAARRAAAIDILRSGFSGPLFVVWVRLWIAAAEDEELAAAMRPVEKRLWQLIRMLGRDALPEVADDPAFDTRLAVVFSLLRGLGMQEHFDPRRGERRRDLWPVYRSTISMILDGDIEGLPASRPSLADSAP
jgi:AcrR family transcriptional regulator